MPMFDFLTNFEITLACSAVTFGCGVAFSTKITDFFKGVPADARAVLKSAETDIVGKLASARATVMTDISAKLGVAPAKVAVAPAKAPAAAPVAPAPAAAPIPPVAPVA